MIDGVCFIPCAPALVPEVGRGLDVELGEVRDAVASVIRERESIHQSIAELGNPAHRVVLVGPGAAAAAYGPGDPGSFAGFGVDLEVALQGSGGTAVLPSALAVGAYFARSAVRAWTVDPSGESPDISGDGPTTLVVLGDGSARRTEKAPGYFDERAAGYDDALRLALASGDPAQLASLNLELGVELLAAGAPVWRAVAPLLTRRFEAEVRYAGDPFGVDYLVALWQ